MVWRMVSMQTVPVNQSLGPGGGVEGVTDELHGVWRRPAVMRRSRSGRGRSAFRRHRSAAGQLASDHADEAGSLAYLLPRLSHRGHVEVDDLRVEPVPSCDVG